MTPEEKKALVASVFQDKPVFESKVLDIQNEKDRVEVVEMIASQLIQETLCESLNFSRLKSYDDFSLDGILNAMTQLVSTEAELYLQEKHKYSAVIAKEAVVENQRFIRLHCQAYYTHYGYILFEKIADSYFSNVAALSSAKHASKVLREAIEGSEETPPITAFKNSRRVVYTITQAWQRVHQAYLARKENIGKIQLELSALLEEIEKSPQESDEEKKLLVTKYAEKEALLEQIREKPLDFFNGTVKMMKTAIVQRLTDLSEEVV